MKFYRPSPRGLPTSEFLGEVFVFGAGECIKQRGFNPQLAEVISKQILDGYFSLDEIIKVAPKVKVSLFKEVPCDYGVRLGSQLEGVIARLKSDSDTRRAIAVLARPDDKIPPCIMLVQFLIREQRLVTIAYMRSWDIGLGFAYDVDTFQKMGAKVAEGVGVIQGDIIVLVGSAHLYQ